MKPEKPITRKEMYLDVATGGSTTLDVETTVPPSEIYIKYRGEAVATLSALPAEVSSPEATPEEKNPEETEETENGSEDVSLQHEFEAIE